MESVDAMKNWFIDINTYREQDAGEKANQLFRLKERGFPVPDLFCVTAGCLKELARQSHDALFDVLGNVDYESEESVSAASKLLVRRFQNRHLAETLEAGIAAKIASFPNRRFFSVRSSSNAEDGGSDSFAGQFETFLSVSAEDLAEMILACFASLYSPRVLKYCHSRGIPADSLRMSVIVQQMIPSEFSGVAFSAHPKGLLNEAVVIVGRGTGDQVVEDKVPVTSYYYNQDACAYYYESVKGAPLLPEKMLFEILHMSSEIKKDFNGRADIEFAVAGGMVWLLQARPITTIPDKEQIVLDNSNIVESYPGVSLPLTASFVKEAYAGVFLNLLSIVLPWKHGVDPFLPMLPDMVRDVNGRIYYDINNWYTLLQCMPMREKIIPVWQEMLGITNKEYTLSKRAGRIHELRTYMSMLRHFVRVPRDMEKLNESFAEVTVYFEKTMPEAAGIASLKEIYNGLSERILKKWGITLLNDMYAFIFAGALKAYLKHLKVSDAETIANAHISGILNIESMKPVRSLDKLMYLARDTGCVDALRRCTDNAETEAVLGTLDPAFSGAFHAYIREYGDRAPEELKLESRTFRTDPHLLARAISDRADAVTPAPGGPERADSGKDGSSKEKEANDLSMTLANYNVIRRVIIRFLAERARLGIMNREISRLNRSRIYGMVRAVFLEMGRRYYKDGQLEDSRDVFFLRLDELMAAEKPEQTDPKKLVAARKQEYRTYGMLPAYSRLVFADGIFNKHHISVNSELIDCPDGEVRGIPCSNGIVTAEVLVVHDPQSASNYRNKILVTKMTDPGWVFLLSAAKGIIAEKGSLLSHTAIVSRELKIPSIVGAPNATRLLQTGDIVTMNGNTGEVIVEKKKHADV